MKRIAVLTLGFLLTLSVAGVLPLMAQDAVVNDLVLTGVVRSKDNRKRLENVNVSVIGTPIGTVTNADGTFTLKVTKAEAYRGVEVSHIGYLNSRLSLSEFEGRDGLTVWMTPAPNLLREIVVYGDNPRLVVEEAIRKIPLNFPAQDNMSTAFYRETVQKGRRYISIAEAVMDVFKSTYGERDTGKDRVRLQKGRRLLSQKQSDTLAVKVIGGPNLAIYLDIVKNGDALLDRNNLDFYNFRMEEPVTLDNRMQYVVSFHPRVSPAYALFIGKLYIDYENLSFTRAEFSLDMSDRTKAIQAILHKKPLGLRFKPQEVSYLVTYKQQGEVTCLNYIRNVIRFKCDWKKRLFSSGFTAYSEMVVTDRVDHTSDKIPYKAAFKEKQVFYDLVDEYWNEDFWRDYNIIEPTESLEHAVYKLRKQSR